MAATGDPFDTWLSTRLQQLELDEEVFCGYITGILDDEDASADENVESLVEILEEATVSYNRFRGKIFVLIIIINSIRRQEFWIEYNTTHSQQEGTALELQKRFSSILIS